MMINANKRANYLQRQWKGDFPLAQSFWLNLVAVNFTVAVIWALALPWLSETPALVLALIFIASFVVWLWGAVGTWRSADAYQIRPNAKIWGRLAQAVVVLHALSWLAQGKDFLSDAALASRPGIDTARFARSPEAFDRPLASNQDSQRREVGPESSAFETKKLEGISVSLPRGWQWMGETDSDALNTASEAIGESIGVSAAQGDNRILAAGNAFDDAKVSVATIRLSARSAMPDVSQAELRQALTEPQEAIRYEVVRQGQTVAEAMRRAPQTVFYEVKDGGLRQNESLVCIWTQFEYDTGKGATVSDSWVCPESSRSIKLTTSYVKSRANLYAPVVEQVWRSLKVD